MLNIKKTPRILSAVIALVIVCGLLAGAYVGRIMYIKKYGIHINPTEVITPKNVEFFIQNDDRWKDDYLGQSRYNIGGYGCLLSIIASACTDLGFETNPKDLNILLTENEGFTSSGDIIWYKINETIPNIHYEYKRIFNSGTIMKDLKNGYLPIVMVKYHGTGYQHWVLVVGSNEDDFLIIDPLNKNKEIIPLNTHGKVYYYRVLKN